MLVSGTPFVATPYCQNTLRLSQGMYETIGITNMISTNDGEFLNLTYKLATNSSFRAEMKQLVLKKVDMLFENAEVIYEWVNVLKGIVMKKK
eukprot:g1661.t1